MEDQEVKHEETKAESRIVCTSAAPKRGADPKRAESRAKRPAVEEEEEAAPRSLRSSAPGPLPMPHAGPAPGGDDDDDEESMIMHLPNRMWTELFDELRERPAERNRCWGCRRGALNIASLPYEGYTRLCNELTNKVVEHGLYAATIWADSYFREEVLKKLIAPREVIAQCEWPGVSIVWHFFKHTHIAQYRQLGEMLELEHAADMLSMKYLYMVSHFGDPRVDSNVDPSTVRTLTQLRSLLDKQRKMDPKKTLTYHQGLGSTGKASAVPYAKDRFSGRGVLHD